MQTDTALIWIKYRYFWDDAKDHGPTAAGNIKFHLRLVAAKVNMGQSVYQLPFKSKEAAAISKAPKGPH